MERKEDFKGFNKDEYVPILRDESISFLFRLVQKLEPKNILEIGTYIGYSASIMLTASLNSKLETVEIKEENASLARENLKEFKNLKISSKILFPFISKLKTLKQKKKTKKLKK